MLKKTSLSEFAWQKWTVTAMLIHDDTRWLACMFLNSFLLRCRCDSKYPDNVILGNLIRLYVFSDLAILWISLPLWGKHFAVRKPPSYKEKYLLSTLMINNSFEQLLNKILGMPLKSAPVTSFIPLITTPLFTALSRFPHFVSPSICCEEL